MVSEPVLVPVSVRLKSPETKTLPLFFKDTEPVPLLPLPMENQPLLTTIRPELAIITAPVAPPLSGKKHAWFWAQNSEVSLMAIVAVEPPLSARLLAPKLVIVELP